MYISGKIKENKSVILSTILFAIFIVAVLPVVSDYTKEAIGISESPDMSFGNDTMGLYELAGAYGESGRRIYITLRWTFDLIWPMVYGWFLFSGIKRLSEVLKLKGIYGKMYLIPLISMGFDYLENIGATIVMGFYPQRIAASELLTPYMSLVKWCMLGAAFVALLVLIAITLIVIIYNGRKSNDQRV